MRWLALLAVLTFGCSRLEPPTLTPEGASIVRMKPDGVDLEVRLDANNPNGFELAASAVKAKITVDSKDNVGAIVANEPLTLAPRKRAQIDVPFSVKWSDPAQLVSLADPPRTIAYSVEGAIDFVAHGMHVQTPFSFKGVLSHEQITQATAPPPPPAAPPTASASASSKPAQPAPGKARRR